MKTLEHQKVDELEQAQFRALLGHFPAITFAPLGGVIFSAWVLWDRADNTILVTLGLSVLAVSLIRLLAFAQTRKTKGRDIYFGKSWRRFIISTAFVSGLSWGAFAVLLYPNIDPSSERFLIILMALVPVAPVAALATYIPSFYAYYIPASAPFVVVLLLERTRDGWTSAVLLLILMFATLQFARNFHKNLIETYRLQIKERENAGKLRDSLTTKTQFMSDANHDLRQPLQALELSLFSETKAQDKPVISPNINSANVAVATIKDYLDRLYQYSQLEQDIDPIVHSFPIQPVLDRLNILFGPVANRQGTKLICIASSLWVESDEDIVEILARNLVENAIRHSGSNGTVLVGCRRRQKTFTFHVMDNGPGIAAENQTKIFEEFAQLDNPARDRNKGIGLGLAISKRAARRIGSHLKLQSELGKGSNFHFDLMKGAVGLGQVFEEAHGAETSPQKPMSVLIIDGEIAIRTGFVDLLEHWDHKPFAAKNIDKALELIAIHGPPDLLISDYRLEPYRDGFDAITEVRSKVQKDIPCILITGDTDPAIEARAEKSDCYFFLKPVEIETFKALVAKLAQLPNRLQ
ncbi:MAG: ATP-binding protein [Paracoccaceae bacterium]